MDEQLRRLSQIARLRKVTLILVQPGDKYCLANGEDWHINRSFVCGDEIVLGIYDDSELLVASFFHELGHITNIKDHMFNSEELAWKIGFELAKEYDYSFGQATHNWAKLQLETY